MAEKAKNNYVEVNLSTFLVPGAIVLAGIIIALVIFLSSRDSNDVQKDNDTSTEQPAQFSDPSIVPSSVSVDLDNIIYLGDLENAKYAIVEFSDYQCPYCQDHSAGTLPLIRSTYIDGGDLVYIYKEVALYPPISLSLSIAGRCIFENEGIEKYMDYRKIAYDLETEEYSELASAVDGLNINEGKLKECYEARKFEDLINGHSNLAQTAGVQGVPSFVVGTISEDGYVDGYIIPGAYPFETFTEVLDFLQK
jgi:protein-disulfide isomerase